MLYLPKPSDQVLLAYCNSLLESIKIKLGGSSINQQAKAFLTDAKIREVLISPPAFLLSLHDEFMPLLIPGFDQDEYGTFLPQRNSNNLPNALIRYKESNKLFEIFDYEQFISKSKSKAYKLALAMDRNTCTYCNRLYTSTVQYKDPVTKQVNNETRITRPQFDHWFAHSIYPLLSISFYNLIPSCSVCNSSIKGDADFRLDSHIHPYSFEQGQTFKFSYQNEGLRSYKVIIKGAVGDKIKRHLEEFKISDVYNAHANLELKDLIDLKLKYPENYLDTLFNETFNHFQISKQEIYRMIFGVESEEEDFHKRTFSKFKTDILEELFSIDIHEKVKSKRIE